MKAKRLFYFLPLLLALVLGTVGCSDDGNNEAALCNTWVLVSYGNESHEVLKESEGYYYGIVFQSDGHFSGRAYGNEICGKYNCKGSEISLSDVYTTAVYYEDSDPDKFFIIHLTYVNKYAVTDKELRLYYSKDEYFKFRIKE